MSEPGYARPEGKTWLDPSDPLSGFPGILDCVHCGLCLQACPTYRATGSETDSPRGRIYLLRAAAEGRVEGPQIEDALARCVLCRACEPICPSQVPYHRLVERHREGKATGLLRFGLRRILPSPRALRWTGFALRSLRRLGLLRLTERIGTRRLRALAGAVPKHPARFSWTPGQVFPAQGVRRGRVALQTGCVNSELFGAVLRDTITLLTAQGFDVVVPGQPGCCGALHAHSGDADFGRQLATRSFQAFPTDVDAILVPSAGCAAHLHEHDPRRGVADPLLFLHKVGLRGPLRPVKLRLAYDPPCHLLNVLGAKDEVGALLRQIPELQLVPHDEAELCCGAGGISFARAPEMSDAVLGRKIERILAAAPDVVASGNPGCLLRLEAGLRARRSPIRAVHPVQILAQACAKAPAPR